MSADITKVTPPPHSPRRCDSLSALTLPKKNELIERKHAKSLIPEPPDAEKSPQMNRLLSPSSHVMKSTPDLTTYVPKGIKDEDCNLLDTYDRSLSESSKWASSSNPSYCPIRNIDILSRYEVYTEKNPASREGSSEFHSTELPSSNDGNMSVFARDYQNITTFRSETSPALSVRQKTIFTPLQTPQMPKWGSIEDIESASGRANVTSTSDKMTKENTANMYSQHEKGSEDWSKPDKPDVQFDHGVSKVESCVTGAEAINPMYPTQSELQASNLLKRRSATSTEVVDKHGL